MKAKHTYFAALNVSLVSLIIFILFAAQGIYGGDSGDLVSAAFLGGVPHPPGYPLYTFIGWLISHLPVLTVSFRIGLISALSHALVSGLVFLIIHKLTQKFLPALFGTLALIGNYLFFLYAVTPEVFATLDLFVTILIYELILWQENRKNIYFYAAVFTFGLSLTHHQLILFSVPAVLYLFWINKNLATSRLSPLHSGIIFILGLLPFLYIPLAARGNSIINWDRAVDISGFMRLVTRADYGTFVSGGFYGSQLVSRLLQIKAYFEITLSDLTWTGIILSVFGLIFLYRKNRNLLGFFLLGLIFLGPIFLFYASFPLLNSFNIGTYERFLLPANIIIYILVGLGFGQLDYFADKFVQKRLSIWEGIARPAFMGVIFLFPIVMLGVTVLKFTGLPADRTAENLGIDMLKSLPDKSILILYGDTPLFTTQYARYVLGERKDVFVLQGSSMDKPYYQSIISRNFPGLGKPDTSGAKATIAFIRANQGNFPVFTNSPFPMGDGYNWVQYGLVFKMVPDEDLLPLDDFINKNEKIWSGLHSPQKGILSRYNHLMLTDVVSVYAGRRTDYARTLLKAGKTELAKTELEKALDYGGDNAQIDTYILLGLSELYTKNCQKALDYFQLTADNSPLPDKNLALYRGITWRDCFGDPGRAKKYFDEYERLSKKEETPLAK